MPAIDFSNPLLWILIVSGVLHAIHLAITSAIFLGFVFVLVKKAKADVHSWAAALSKWLTGLGFSATVTNPLDKIAEGDGAGALGAGGALITYVLNPVNAAKEFSVVLPKLWSDPTIGPAVQQVVADIQKGASQSVLQGDLTPVITQARASVPQAPIVTQMHDLVSHLPNLAQNPQLQSLAQLLMANGQTSAIPALLAGHAVAATAAGTAVAGPAGTIAALAGEVAKAAPVLAVEKALQGVGVTGLQDGHIVQISAKPGSPAAAASPTVTDPPLAAAA